MAGRNANHYTRTDYTNYNEILSITILEQIFETFTFNEENLGNSTEIFQMFQRTNTDPWQKVS